MVSLPRSARLATWATAWLAGEEDLDDVVKRVESIDEPHDAEGVPGTSDTVSLPETLSSLRDAGAAGFRVALPEPGDPTGLAGPPGFNSDALDAGEAVLATGTSYGLVPGVRPFGPPGDQGYFVTWRCQPAIDPPAPQQMSEAEQSLSTALLRAGDALARLDVSAWKPEVATLLQDLRSGQVGEPLPRLYAAKAQTIAARSTRILAIVTFALNDDGSAVTLAAAQSRRDVLTPLATAARHALVAACNNP